MYVPREATDVGFRPNVDLSTLIAASSFFIEQKKELAELLGFETRNKYEIACNGQAVAYAAEGGRGTLAMLGRQFFGHMREFTLDIYSLQRSSLLHCVHPLRFFLQRFEVFADGRRLGAVQQKFALLRRVMTIEDELGQVMATIESPWSSPWTFHVLQDGHELAVIRKKWSGLVKEAFTDADNFTLDITGPMRPWMRAVLLAATVFIDIAYFERKAS